MYVLRLTTQRKRQRKNLFDYFIIFFLKPSINYYFVSKSFKCYRPTDSIFALVMFHSPANSPLCSPLTEACVTESDLFARNFCRPGWTITSGTNESPPADSLRFPEFEESPNFNFDFILKESGRKNETFRSFLRSRSW